MINDSFRHKLSSLDAFLAADSNDIDDAIDSLAKNSDPESLRRRIVLLLKANRINDAYSVIKTHKLSHEWIESGIRTAVKNNDYILAGEFVHRSESLGDVSGTIKLRCIVALIDEVISKNFAIQLDKNYAVDSSVIEPELSNVLDKNIEALSTYSEEIYKNRKINTPLENEAITLFLLCLSYLGRSGDAKKYIPILINYGSINVYLGQIVSEGKLPIVDGFADALSNSNPDDFYSQIFAEILRYRVDSDHKSSFSNLTSLSSKAEDEEKRGILYTTLSLVALEGGEPFISQLNEYSNSLLNSNNPRHQTRVAVNKIQLKCWNDAVAILNDNKLENDPFWLRASAQCDFEKGDKISGLSKYVSASLSYKSEAWLLETSDRAMQLEQYSEALLCLKCLKEYYPWNYYARNNYISLLIHDGFLPEAIAENEKLLDILKNDTGLIVQLSYLYFQTNEADKALRLLEEMHESGIDSVQSVILASTILRNHISPKDGFILLNKYKDKYWGHKEFLFAYLDLGYASNNDKQANDAFQEINKLKEKGEIDPKAFRSASIDEVKDLIHESYERKIKIYEQYIQGKVPWMMCSELLHKTIYFDWAIRTQKIMWLNEDVASRAELSIYSTNGFGSDINGDQSTLAPIRATEDVRSICLDYSALITLHSLEMLELFSSSFDIIYLPEIYRSNTQEERRKIQPHQLSHYTGYSAIKALVERGEISIQAADQLGSKLLIDEYGDKDESRDLSTKSLAHLFASLSNIGKIDKNKYEEVTKVIDNKLNSKENIISINEHIVIEIVTLMTIYREGVLDAVVDAFNVSIAQGDYDEVLRDIQGFDFQSSVLDNYNMLWDELSQYPNVHYVMPHENVEETSGIALSAYRISDEKNLPLFTDDRVLQALVINAKGSVDTTSYGTDVFLHRALDNESIDIAKYSECILTLMRWRYKFLVPKAEMLHYFTTRYLGVAPGEELNIIARYLHDCMRDPGLFGGLENTDPPTSIAIRLYITWASRIGEYLALVWNDNSIDNDRSQAITEWVGSVLLPSVPSVIELQYHNRLASNLAEIIVVNALLRAGELSPHKRVPGSLRNLSRILGITDFRHERLISEVIARAAE